MKQQVPLIVANWKMNPSTQEDALALAVAVAKKQKQQKNAKVVLAVPFPYLTEIAKKITRSTVRLAAQNLSTEPLGAFTGEVSAAQLRNLGVEYVIIGHSERRAMGETNEQVQKKILMALKHSLTPIVCIGEKTRDEHGAFFGVVETQLRSIAGVLKAADIKKVVIAYEPIWALSTTKNGHVATPDDAKEMQLFIESVLTKLYDRKTARTVRVMYGGSVNATNVTGFHHEGGMAGFLVGGASLKAEEFNKIISLVST
ncbi:MAG: triose-phosphate isomerase [Patescibacteria group bacterium]